MWLQGLTALAGTGQGGGGSGFPGFDNSSSAESSAGPITVGGLTFAPSNQDTIIIAMIVVAAALVAVAMLKRGR